MRITCDPTKRAKTLQERGLDFEDAAKVFDGNHTVAEDNRFAYGETRYISGGFLDGRVVVIVWTSRGGARHIISMRYCHGKEEAHFRQALG